MWCPAVLAQTRVLVAFCSQKMSVKDLPPEKQNELEGAIETSREPFKCVPRDYSCSSTAPMVEAFLLHGHKEIN